MYIPEMLREFDIGVIPYPESVYNNGRIPIKIFEYAACKVAILASETTAHQRILSESIATFYNNNASAIIGASLARVKESYEEIINSIVENLSQ